MTVILDAISLAELETVHPDLRKIVHETARISTVEFQVGKPAKRTVAQQAENVRRGVSKTMDSRHLPDKDGFSRATDLIVGTRAKPSWDWGAYFKLAVFMKIAAETCEIPEARWGGVWDRRLNQLSEDMKGEQDAYVKRRKAIKPKAKVFLDGPHLELMKSERYP